MLNLEAARRLDFRVKSDVLGCVCLGKEKKRKKRPTCSGICWCQRTHLPARSLVAGTGTWGTAEDGVMLGVSPQGAPELILSSPSPFIFVLHMLKHPCSSLICLLFPVFTRRLGADSPEPRAGMEAEKPTTHDTEPTETEQSQSSNSRQAGHQDSGRCFQSSFLQIFAITLACF